MLQANETEVMRAESRERKDLKHEYRPIGIGAVVAALTVSNKFSNDHSHTAENSSDQRGARGTLAT
jgi:hypothetical protein